MKLGIIGAGYVGLTTAICLASMKHEINIFDIDNEKIKSINEKKMPFFEPGLEELLDVNISKRTKNIDKNAAAFILQGAIDFLNN